APALFATVFTIGAMTRHSELTAAKASGISFYRMIAPLSVGALVAMMLGLVVGEVVPISTSRRNEILGAKARAGAESNYSFAYASENGRVYTVAQLDAKPPGGNMRGLEIERRGKGDPGYPTVITVATNAEYTPDHGWLLHEGFVHILPTDSLVLSVKFVAMRDYRMTERPTDCSAPS